MRVEIKNELGLYPVSEYELPEGITFIAGCNGGGKSTLIEETRQFFMKNRIPFSYLDCNKDFHFRQVDDIEGYDLHIALQKGWVSEHEHYENMFKDWVSRIRPQDNFKKYGVFIDGLDSGGDVVFYENHLSLFKTVYDDCTSRGIEVYIVVTCNNFKYLTSEYHNCIFVPTFKTAKLPLYSITEFQRYEEDIKETARARNFL